MHPHRINCPKNTEKQKNNETTIPGYPICLERAQCTHIESIALKTKKTQKTLTTSTYPICLERGSTMYLQRSNCPNE